MNSGADFIEVDIRSRDGEIIIAHDLPEPGLDYPRLDEVLNAVDGRSGLHLDLKETGFEEELVSRALQRLEPRQVVVTPDFDESARLIKRRFPGIRVSPIDFATLDQARANEEWPQLPVWIWTVDDKKLMKRFLADPRVECIITNRPDLALKVRKARS